MAASPSETTRKFNDSTEQSQQTHQYPYPWYQFHSQQWPYNCSESVNTGVAAATFPQKTMSSHSYQYFVRMINPKKKSDFMVRIWHDTAEKFVLPATVKLRLMESFPDDMPSKADFQVEYYEPSGTK
uniref:Uncharacterized protein n=1 Tax=Amphimedon queenslandica TaxID=400682 RepID=A0A1X7U0Z1_AMPQE